MHDREEELDQILRKAGILREIRWHITRAYFYKEGAWTETGWIKGRK